MGRWRTSSSSLDPLGSALALLAFVTITLGLAAAVTASAVYAHRAAVTRARTPVPVEISGEPAALRWQHMGDSIDERAVGSYAIEPLLTDAPLPPGVTRWPEPGEAVLSPALRDLLTDRGMPDRYGHPAGIIGRDGLASRTELLTYVRLPVPLDDDRAWRVARFGARRAEPTFPISEVAYDRSVIEFWSLALLLTVLPGVVALAAAGRVADSETRRRHVLLARLGADRRARALVALPRVLPPCLLSLALCLTLVGTAAAVDLTVPVKGNVVDAAVVRGVLPLLVGLVLGVHVLAATALALTLASRQARLAATRLEAPRDAPAWGRTVLLLLVLACQPWIIALVANQTVRSLSTLAAALVAAVCLPAALATLLRAVSAWRAERDLAAGRAGRFLGWRITSHRSRALARLTGSICGLVVVVGHAAVVLGLFTGPALEARQAAERVGTSVLVASPEVSAVSIGDVVNFAHDRGLAAMQVQREPEGLPAERVSGARAAGVPVTFAGACPDLMVLGLPCSDGPLAAEEASPTAAELSRWYGDGSGAALVAVGAPDGRAEGPLVLVNPDGADLDALAIARDAHRRGLPLRVEQLGAGWIVGAVDLLNKSYWVFVFGVPGVLTLLLVGALTWAAVVVEESKALVRSPLLAERQDVFSAVAAVRIAVPVATGGIAGAAATAWLLAPHAQIGSGRVPVGFLLGVSLASPAVAAAAWRMAWGLMAAASRQRWGPWDAGRVSQPPPLRQPGADPSGGQG